MTFLEPKLDVILPLLSKLEQNTKPIWGEMSAQRMVEHLTDALSLARGEITLPLEFPSDKTEKVQGFLKSEHPLPVNFEAGFAPKSAPIRNADLSAAIEEFQESWKNYESFFAPNPEKTTLHPNFGELNFELWQTLNSKHLTHHCKQFRLI